MSLVAYIAIMAVVVAIAVYVILLGEPVVSDYHIGEEDGY